MDYRTDTFTKRFVNALPHLLVTDIQGIVSIKFRDDCVNGSEYHRLVDDLQHRRAGLDILPLDRQLLGGSAWLVKDANQRRAILVEHETGLEILGAAASVASLIAIIPLVGSAWARIRDRFFSRDQHGVEIRRFDSKSVLVEEQAPSIEVYVLNVTLQEHTQLREKISELEQEVKRLKAPSKKKKTTKSKRWGKKG